MIRRAAAEAVGTGLLLCVIVGSGMMGERLASGNGAIALLANSLATGAGLVALIQIFGPVSGAHFNPFVTLATVMRGAMDGRTAVIYIAAQCSGAVIGIWLTHAMFAKPILQLSHRLREGPSLALSECIATFGLIGTILAAQRFRPDSAPMAVGLYIVAAYWFTASTAFANPAVTIARSLTDSFAGVAPVSVPLLLAGQVAGALAGIGFFAWLFREECPQ